MNLSLCRKRLVSYAGILLTLIYVAPLEVAATETGGVAPEVVGDADLPEASEELDSTPPKVTRMVAEAPQPQPIDGQASELCSPPLNFVSVPLEVGVSETVLRKDPGLPGRHFTLLSTKRSLILDVGETSEAGAVSEGKKEH
jgi:hypothetical protein